MATPRAQAALQEVKDRFLVDSVLKILETERKKDPNYSQNAAIKQFHVNTSDKRTLGALRRTFTRAKHRLEDPSKLRALSQAARVEELYLEGRSVEGAIRITANENNQTFAAIKNVYYRKVAPPEIRRSSSLSRDVFPKVLAAALALDAMALPPSGEDCERLIAELGGVAKCPNNTKGKDFLKYCYKEKLLSKTTKAKTLGAGRADSEQVLSSAIKFATEFDRLHANSDRPAKAFVNADETLLTAADGGQVEATVLRGLLAYFATRHW